MNFSQKHLQDFHELGYCILHDALSEDHHLEIATALRKALPCWEDVKSNSNTSDSQKVTFPFPADVLNRFFVEPDLLAFARKALGTEAIHYKPGYSIVRYPGGMTGSEQGWHIDNGNNSLLPQSDDMRYGQVVVWYWPEDVTKETAPMRIIPKPYGNDQNHAITLDVPANTLFIMHNYLWHSGSDFEASHGQRYSHGGMLGVADFHWEGLLSLTHLGRNKTFQSFIGSLSPEEREVFRFPPRGHSYYTKKTLALLESQYPGWDAREYLENKPSSP